MGTPHLDKKSALASIGKSGAQRDGAPPGLEPWLRELGISQYVDLAASWAAEMGACDLIEVAQHAQELAQALNLKPLLRINVVAARDRINVVAVQC